jgi:hypothetical protein
MPPDFAVSLWQPMQYREKSAWGAPEGADGAPSDWRAGAAVWADEIPASHNDAIATIAARVISTNVRRAGTPGKRLGYLLPHACVPAPQRPVAHG